MQQLTKEYRIVFRKSPFYLLVLVVLMLQACIKTQETDLEKQQKADEEKLQAYFKEHPKDSNKVDINYEPDTKGSGYYYIRDPNPQTGNPLVKSNDIVGIHYKVSTLDGIFTEDSLNSKNLTKLRALTQTGSLLPIGLDAGLSLMHKGEKYTFFIPSTLAFGNYSSTSSTLNFPANSNLIIEVRVDSILTDAQQNAAEYEAIQKYLSANNITNAQPTTSGLFYQKTLDGTGTTLPLSGNTVTVNYIGKYLDGTIFDQNTSTPFTFVIGASKVIPGFEEGIKLMHKGEKGRIFLPSSLAYGATRQVIPQRIRPDLVERGFIDNPADQLRPFAVLVFEVELTNIQ